MPETGVTPDARTVPNRRRLRSQLEPSDWVMVLFSLSSARRSLGRVGAFLPVNPGDRISAEQERDAVRRLEAAGYPSAWTNESIGKDAFVQVGIILAETASMTFGTCIANMWARPAQTALSAAAQLADAYPGRFVLGLGVGYTGQARAVGREFGKPLATARAYLEQLDPRTFPCVLGAMGPKMLALAGELADGALPAGTNPDLTASARDTLGPHKLLVVYVDAGIGEPGAVAELVEAHRGAGADHVIAGTAMGSNFAAHISRLEQLAAVLL